MNFFEQQEQARKSTKRLVFLFSLAVFLLVLITNLVFIGSLWLFDASLVQKQQLPVQSFEDFTQHFNVALIAKISVTVVSLIAMVIFFKRMELSGGGKVIAERLGGKLLATDTQDHREKMALNVVEEMAIASGMPVPNVYLLPEMSINAFAAGFNTSDAVIGLSKGAVQNLTRDQLQGVVAHEFSHILNGDMRLNINLIAVLSGILFIGQSGWFIVRSFGSTRSRRSSKDSGSAIALVGFALVAVGYVGTFFGSLIKAAVSRQREFLADASAVQFTRNPEGISGALKLIGGSRFGSLVHAAHAHEMSHLFFSNALSQKFSNTWNSWFSTHPALEERIRRIEPNWNGLYLKMANEDRVAEKKTTAEKHSATKTAVAGAVVAGAILARVVEQGEQNDESVQAAEHSVAKIDIKLHELAHRKSDAQHLVLAMLVSDNHQLQAKQLENLNSHFALDYQQFSELLAAVSACSRRELMSLLELSVAALKQMSFEEYQIFLKALVELIKADGQIDLFEWILHSILVQYLKPQFQVVRAINPKYRSFARLEKEVQMVLSYMLDMTHEQKLKKQAMQQACAMLSLRELPILGKQALNLNELNKAVVHFSHLFPLQKPALLKACICCIEVDGQVAYAEYELLRALAILLDCPMPMLKYEVSDE